MFAHAIHAEACVPVKMFACVCGEAEHGHEKIEHLKCVVLERYFVHNWRVGRVV